MSCTCGCCAGTEVLTPVVAENRPGLDALAYRVGTHASFLTTMLARLSGAESSALAGLTTRDPADPAIALLDAWATIGDLLSFYQERIAQEGYLRTAAEGRSLLELARLVGYVPRPGVSASAHLAFVLESGQAVTVPAGTRAQSVPGPGELPQPFETSEAVEARAEWNLLVPRQTRPQRITLDRSAPDPDTDVTLVNTVYFEGTATNLRPNDPLLFVFGDEDRLQEPRFVESVQPDAGARRTCVTLQSEVRPGFIERLATVVTPAAKKRFPAGTAAGDLLTTLETTLASEGSVVGLKRQAIRLRDELARLPKLTGAAKTLADKLDDALQPVDRTAAAARAGEPTLDGLLRALSTAPSVPPASRFRLARDPRAAISAESDALPRLITALRPQLRDRLFQALARARVDPGPWPKVYALRLQASLYGHNAPKQPVFSDGALTGLVEWSVFGLRGTPLEQATVIDLAGSHPEVLPDSWLVVQTHPSRLTPEALLFVKAGSPDASLSRADYGISGEITRITLLAGTRDRKIEWIRIEGEGHEPADDDFTEIRQTSVYAQPEELLLAEEPIPGPICGGTIELDAVYEGLEAGRWLLVTGERAGIDGVSGLMDAELVMIAGVRQDVAVARDVKAGQPSSSSRTVLSLAGRGPAGGDGLAFCYRRPTVSIYGNVAHATHGETRREVLGSGDASKTFQEFSLRQAPLTFVSAATPDGAASTLQVRVDDLLWHETDGLGWAGPRDRRYVTRADEKSKTSIRFGDGLHGLRLPAGVENVRALYRNGIGKPGNVAAGRIAQLATRPLGVKSVLNPLRSSGGADPDGPDQTRRNIPLATSPLDRLVSVEDYADFARRFAGIGKASAARLSDGHAQVVHVTIAGADDIPIDETSDLFRSLATALHQYGDPYQRVQLAPRESLLLVISAGVKLLPDYEWESVEPRVRDRLLWTFGFDRRALGQSAFLSEVIASIQQIPGVAYVDVDVFDAISEGRELADIGRVAATPARNEYVSALPDRRNPQLGNRDEPRLLPAQLAWLTPAVPDTLLLQVLP